MCLFFFHNFPILIVQKSLTSKQEFLHYELNIDNYPVFMLVEHTTQLFLIKGYRIPLGFFFFI